MYGYTGKLLFVNLSTNEIDIKDLDEKMAKDYIGGPSLGAKILYDNMPAKCDAFSEESMIGFVGGPFNNTPVISGGRYTVVSKSPITGGWNDANSGGFFGQYLKKAGFDAIFVKGIAPKPVYIVVDDGKVEIKDASDLMGLRTIELEEKLKAEYGKCSVASIGVVGENCSHLACVMNDEHRAAGRGGSGAVMGSKKLKAIVAKGNVKIEVADKAKVLEVNKANLDAMHAEGNMFFLGMSTGGTGGNFTGSCVTGDAGIANWGGSVEGGEYSVEKSDKLGSRYCDPLYKTKKYACSTCAVGCGAMYSVDDPKYPELKYTTRPEYETLGAFGSMCCNGDPIAVMECNHLCNEYGIDTISAGDTIAWAMECYENGIFTKEELDGIELNWGNGDATVEMCLKMCKCEGVGAIMDHGSQYAADHFGKGHEYLVVAKGIEEPMHDSRLSINLSRTYQYDPTPGRHVKGGVPRFIEATDENRGDAEKIGVSSCEVQNASGFCALAGSGIPTYVNDSLKAVTDFGYTDDDLYKAGLRSFMLRHAFNLREGFARKDMTISKRYVESPENMEGPLKGVVVPHEHFADKFFEGMHMDLETMIPTKEFLEEIGGLENVIKEIYK